MYRKLLLLVPLTLTPAVAGAGFAGERTDRPGGPLPPQATGASGQAALKLASLTAPTRSAPRADSRRTAAPPPTAPEPAASAWNGYNPALGDTAGWWSSY